MISIFDDRIEFISVGGLVNRISYEDIMLGISIARNENLANVFYRLKLIEAYGTGIPKIFKSYDEKQLKPTIEVSDNAFKITLPNINYATENMSLSDAENSVLDLVRKNRKIDRKEIEKTLEISQSKANKILRNLVEQKFIEISGKGKNTKYLRSNL